MNTEIIKQLCDKSGTSIKRLEKDLGFSNGSISKWKDAEPSSSRLAAVAEYFGLSVDFILSGDTEALNKILPSIRLRKEIKTNPDMKSGERLYFLMDNSGIPLPELSRYAGTGQDVLLQWINENTLPNWNVIERVKGYYGISDNDLFSKEELKEIEIKKQPAGFGELSEDEIKLLAAYRKIMDQKKPGYLDMLERAAEHKE